ncbi:MAG: hypothetical protein COZ92_01860 [Candidatus Nealsonbacteria bacterium CG_4_8_14_3_um_filter_40_11]|uniref:Uncharacterized protein n=1 Tax=Candidatus Nealsonbacteria bacterium CG_4_8_14_3_um_filter_40_11 TaxID=1974690 RepID=A0A2M7IJT6_9BACT|nr:MAG: hypothetical protein COZ92_01860 [Candidatus Nealsonbacteria bacterium CG_4_8_14_3_um_filter_40_11]
MKKFSWVLALFILIVTTVLPIAVGAETAKCCKLAADLRWISGKIYSGTVFSDGNPVNCTDASPCNCSDKSNFSSGCYLSKGKTVGPEKTAITCDDGTPPYYKTDAQGMICLLNGIKMVTNWFSTIVMALAIAFIALGGFNIITAGGTPDKVTTGKNYIVFALIAFFISALSKIVPSIIVTLMGLSK